MHNEKQPALHQHLYLSRMSSDDGPAWWDSMVIDPFLTQLRALQKMGLPAICANPDFRAFEKPKDGDIALPVVRQGLVAETYREMGGRVIEFGKTASRHFQICVSSTRDQTIAQSGRDRRYVPYRYCRCSQCRSDTGMVRRMRHGEI